MIQKKKGRDQLIAPFNKAITNANFTKFTIKMKIYITYI
jgi:hypothetical protein